MPPEAEKVAEKVESSYERLHNRYLKFTERWQQHANRRTVIATIAIGLVVGALSLFVIRPPANFPSGELVTIDEGQSLSEIAQTLEKSGVIRSDHAFRIIVKVLREDRMLHAGDYLFKEPVSIFAVASRVAQGAFGLEPFRFRIPEGATVKQMAGIYSTVLQRFNKDKFTAAALPQEGYLFPDTYFFLPNATEKTVIDAMRQNFDTQVPTSTPEIASSTHSLHDLVIMASILEREARNYEDRQLIAGVLWRRIKIGMPMQADATFLYTLGKGSFDLTMADLRSDSPYNTYKNKGLPPTPIGSPSLDAIRAAANPVDKGYLYYMADNTGVTHYSKTYAGQQENVRLYLGR